MQNPFTGIVRKALSIIYPNRQSVIVNLPNTSYDYKGKVGEGRSSNIIMACVRWSSKNFPAPVVLERISADQDWERQLEHPMLSILKRPNPHYGSLLLLSATVTDLMITGNAYWLKLRSGAGRPVQLWWVPSTMMEPRWPEGDKTTFIGWYDYAPGGGAAMKVLPQDVVHFRDGLDPANVRKGLSPLASLFREVFTDNEAANMTASLLKNMGIPGVIISPADSGAAVSLEVLEAVKRKFAETFRGDKRGEPLVMTSATKTDTFGFSPQQLDLKALRRIPEERVSAIFGVPAIIAGLGAGLDRSTFANYAEAKRAAYESHIIPMQNIAAEVLQNQLLTDFEDDLDQWQLSFDLSQVAVLQEDRNRLSERVVRLVQGGLYTVAEGRRMMGDDADESHEIYLRPMAFFEVPVGQPSPGQLPSGAEEPEEQGQKAETKARVRMTQRQRNLMLAMRRDAEGLEAVFSKRLEGQFAELGRQARAAFEAAKAEKADPVDEALVRQVIARIGITQFAKGKLAPAYQGHYRLTAETVYGTVNRMLNLSLFLEDPVAKRILEMGGRRAGLIDLEQQTKDAMFRALAEGRDAGESGRELARRVQERVSAGPWQSSAIRGQIISRTETKYAQFNSSVEAYKQSGVVTGYLLLDAQLGPTDADCEARNGTVVTAEEARAAMEAEHPNGTLSIVPVVG